jgi:CBS domain-containing protein
MTHMIADRRGPRNPLRRTALRRWPVLTWPAGAAAAHAVQRALTMPPASAHRLPERLMKVREILQSKGRSVVTIGPGADIAEAIRVLVEHNIGALVVENDGGIVGILTERDLLRAAAEDLSHLGDARVADLMTRSVITGTGDAEIDAVMHVMSERRIRHLPIVEDGRIAGMISIGDVINALRVHSESENRYLHAYITGVPL